MDQPFSGFLVLGVVFAVVNTVLMCLIAWQLWVVRSRFDRAEFIVVSFIGSIVHRAQGVARRVGYLVHEIGRAVDRVTTRR